MDVLMPDGTTITDVPDGTTRAQLLAKYQAHQSLQADSSQPGYVPGLAEGMNAISQIPRQIGLTVRAGLGGLGGIANTVLDPAVAGINAVSGANLPIPSQAMERTLSKVLPTPANAEERVVQAGARAMVPVAGSVQAGRMIPSLAPLAVSPVTQLLSGAGGATASQGAAELGAGPGRQALAGLLGGVAGPTALAAANAAARAALRVPGSLIAPLTRNGQMNTAANIYQKSALSPQTAIENIQNAPQYVPGVTPTTASLADDSGISALYKTLKNQAAPQFANAEAANDAARQAFLAQNFGNETSLNAAKSAREAATAPLRDQSLAVANTGGAQNAALDARIAALQAQAAQAAASKARALQNAGQLQTTAAQQSSFANNFAPVPGMPRVPASLSPNAELVPSYLSGAQDFSAAAVQQEARRQALSAAAEQLANQERAPSLQSAPLLSSIQSTLDAPGLRASDVVQKTLADVQSKIAKFTNANGVIDANDLYTIRKELGNTISGFAKESNNWDKRLTAGLQNGIQEQIDQAIVSAGAQDWPQYLRQYADLSRGINTMQLGQDIYKSSLSPSTETLLPGSFARQVANNGPDIAAMGPRGSDAIMRVNEDLKRSVAPMNTMRTAGSDTTQNLVGNQILQSLLGRLPGGAASNMVSKLTSLVYSPAESRIKQLLINGQLDPQLGAQLLSRPLPQKPDLTLELLQKLLPISYGGLLGTISAQ